MVVLPWSTWAIMAIFRMSERRMELNQSVPRKTQHGGRLHRPPKACRTLEISISCYLVMESVFRRAAFSVGQILVERAVRTDHPCHLEHTHSYSIAVDRGGKQGGIFKGVVGCQLSVVSFFRGKIKRGTELHGPWGLLHDSFTIVRPPRSPNPAQ